MPLLTRIHSIQLKAGLRVGHRIGSKKYQSSVFPLVHVYRKLGHHLVYLKVLLQGLCAWISCTVAQYFEY